MGAVVVVVVVVMVPVVVSSRIKRPSNRHHFSLFMIGARETRYMATRKKKWLQPIILEHTSEVLACSRKNPTEGCCEIIINKLQCSRIIAHDMEQVKRLAMARGNRNAISGFQRKTQDVRLLKSSLCLRSIRRSFTTFLASL